jgi:Holliday junction resolvase RusA-like endonuclease
MTKIHLTVLGSPKAQARHRSFKRGNFTGTYDPSSEKKEILASIVQDQAPKEPLTGAISLDVTFYLPRPKGHYGSGANALKLKGSAPEWHTSKPDIDNLEKLVQDSLNKIFWKDDSQICLISCRKLYSEKPRTEIFISDELL